MWIQGIRVGVLRVFTGIPGFLGLSSAESGCPLAGVMGPARVLGQVLGSAVNPGLVWFCGPDVVRVVGCY